MTALPEPVSSIASPFRMDYTYVAGSGRSIFLRGLAHRRLLARRCPGCQRAYCPAPQFCSRCLTELGEPFPLAGTGTVETFCIVSFPFPGQVFAPPYAVAHIRLHGADNRLMHMIGDTAPDLVHIGMTVEPVWVTDEELGASMQSIRYFRPVPDKAAHA
ncbi:MULTISPECIES: Zn-ribbon domain-containing OB-fold protein [Mycobacteroides]|uniref:DNA-binding protein n=1 Tax=Mycobacteroides chelonae TaxID=1774 RepID=A0A1S1LYL3_MYCCH|nr:MULTISPECIES: Zn-ribbon domain-containing OB-fold protein [Mycobacteroides]KRQ26538.1 DNA-binding protein [Mycobacteroides sp. H003]KRQ37967.1 DNA-binding protein [Mycobacteroides sp. H101]KRQ38261.1 DNA-binding protein [Mycobacteroides sp. H092]KRQ46181.1 DNA-binding protein [Mycobacteroides sp. H063]KRQ56983.1 DNA-binding protein [Mycobacteroides sp. H079]